MHPLGGGADASIGFARDDDLVVGQAALLQFAHDVPAEESGAAGDDDDFAGPVVGRLSTDYGNGLNGLAEGGGTCHGIRRA